MDLFPKSPRARNENNGDKKVLPFILYLDALETHPHSFSDRCSGRNHFDDDAREDRRRLRDEVVVWK